MIALPNDPCEVACGHREPCDCLHLAGCHDVCDPDACFTAKMRYWRDVGASVIVPRGFHG